jgi:hypothetical protein
MTNRTTAMGTISITATTPINTCPSMITKDDALTYCNKAPAKTPMIDKLLQNNKIFLSVGLDVSGCFLYRKSVIIKKLHAEDEIAVFLKIIFAPENIDPKSKA